MHPMTRSAGIAEETAPSGSSLSIRRPSQGPPCRWKYHHGIPFWADTTAVSGPRSGASSGETSDRLWALTVRKTKSTSPTCS